MAKSLLKVNLIIVFFLIQITFANDDLINSTEVLS